MRKYYPGITLFKLIGCLLVLFGHVRLPTVYLQLSEHIAGLKQAMAFTVPCFYMISGFLAYKGWTGAANPRRYIGRYVGWIGGFYLLMCVVALVTGTGTPLGAWVWPVRNMVLPLAKLYLVIGPYASMWFIPPLVFGVLVCYYCQRAGRLAWAIWMAVAGFVLAQLLDGALRQVLHNWHLDAFMYHTRYGYAELLTLAVSNYFGIGFPFVLAGVLVARHEERFCSLPGRRLAAVALASLAIEYMLLRWLSAGGSYRFGLVMSMVPVELWLFYGVLHIQSVSIRKHHAFINRFSIILYFLHMPLLYLNAQWLGQSTEFLYFNWSKQTMTVGQSVLHLLLAVAEAVLLTLALHAYLNRRYPPATAPAPLADTPAAVGRSAPRPAPARAR